MSRLLQVLKRLSDWLDNQIENHPERIIGVLGSIILVTVLGLVLIVVTVLKRCS